jgi:ribosomal protein S27AE
MRNGKCPKCGKPTVYAKQRGMSFGDGGIHVYTGAMISKPVPVDHYLCTSCGYFEAYVADPEKLSAVAQSWTKVG